MYEVLREISDNPNILNPTLICSLNIVQIREMGGWGVSKVWKNFQAYQFLFFKILAPMVEVLEGKRTDCEKVNVGIVMFSQDWDI